MSKKETDKKKNIENDRLRAVDLAISSIEKQFGKGAILRMDGDAIARTSTSSRPARRTSILPSVLLGCRAVA